MVMLAIRCVTISSRNVSDGCSFEQQPLINISDLLRTPVMPDYFKGYSALVTALFRYRLCRTVTNVRLLDSGGRTCYGLMAGTNPVPLLRAQTPLNST